MTPLKLSNFGRVKELEYRLSKLKRNYGDVFDGRLVVYVETRTGCQRKLAVAESIYTSVLSHFQGEIARIKDELVTLGVDPNN